MFGPPKRVRPALLAVAFFALLGCDGGSAPGGDGGGDDATQDDGVDDGSRDELDVADGSDDGSADEAQVPDGSDADGGFCDLLPAGGLFATFVTAGPETFHAQITDAAGISEAIALWHGTSTANIPVGTLVCSPVGWNCPFHWYMDPATLRFAQLTIELCDGLPSFVEMDCPGFDAGTFCPWTAVLVELRDCRTDPSCPPVP